MERRGRRRRGERNADVEWDGCRQELLVLMRGGRHRVEKGGVSATARRLLCAGRRGGNPAEKCQDYRRFQPGTTAGG